MELNKTDVFGLPLNFPQTFLPERRLLAQLLTFAQKGGSGDKVSIGAETGIPTGKSTGKVEPMIYYARGMGLITVNKTSSHWQLGLTSLGSIVLQEDPFLSEPQTLWLLHLMLSRRFTLSSPASGVADAWFALFAEGGFRLGSRFTQASFLNFLIDRHGEKSYLKSLAGVVIRSYLEDSCLGHIDVLQSTEDEFFIRQSAPLETSFFPFYATFLYLVWDELFISENQISLDHFSQETRCFSVMAWDDAMVARWLDWMADKGIIQVDRYTGTPMLLRLQETNQVVSNSYSELI
ncbi:DUF4007 family protein [Methylomonas sp. LL1]|uniref:DUF4007 family protein n=1 Tax=Methylomonas sp. LL1 TaxID=2785785 RepID=UPI001E29CD19|nr:DUF4007 family protein [Methylomonas sp. LL1]